MNNQTTNRSSICISWSIRSEPEFPVSDLIWYIITPLSDSDQVCGRGMATFWLSPLHYQKREYFSSTGIARARAGPLEKIKRSCIRCPIALRVNRNDAVVRGHCMELRKGGLIRRWWIKFGDFRGVVSHSSTLSGRNVNVLMECIAKSSQFFASHAGEAVLQLW